VQAAGPLSGERTITTVQGNEIKITNVIPAGFSCPCHGGSYDTEGNVTAGPPVRAMDRYEFAIVNGRLHLGPTYSVGKVTGEGANAEITKYELHGPGQHVDDWEWWWYPGQPPH
jgi:hypothetical protein